MRQYESTQSRFSVQGRLAMAVESGAVVTIDTGNGCVRAKIRRVEGGWVHTSRSTSPYRLDLIRGVR